MDSAHFEVLSRLMSDGTTRRTIARLVRGLALGWPFALRGPADAIARKNRKKKKKKCKGGKKKCGKKCVPSTTCCSNSDCSGGTCVSGVCICLSGLQPCLGTCISADACCIDGAQNGDETDVDCGGGDCPRCANGKLCESRDDCASAYCPLTVPQVCRECSSSPNNCDSDDDGFCVCDTTVQGQKVCDKNLPLEDPVADCAECPSGTNCVAFDEIIRCFKPCGAS
jgi:hypothetical protein